MVFSNWIADVLSINADLSIELVKTEMGKIISTAARTAFANCLKLFDKPSLRALVKFWANFFAKTLPNQHFK